MKNNLQGKFKNWDQDGGPRQITKKKMKSLYLKCKDYIKGKRFDFFQNQDNQKENPKTQLIPRKSNFTVSDWF